MKNKELYIIGMDPYKEHQVSECQNWFVNAKNVSGEFTHYPNKDIELKEAVEALCKALKEDEDYYRSWSANIAMAFKDEFRRLIGDLIDPDEEQIHVVANNAADNFLKQLIK
jgi:hypothetical protein